MDDQNFKELYPKAFSFCEILKIREKIFLSLRTFFVTVQREEIQR